MSRVDRWGKTANGVRRHRFKRLYDFYCLTTAFTIHICTSYTAYTDGDIPYVIRSVTIAVLFLRHFSSSSSSSDHHYLLDCSGRSLIVVCHTYRRSAAGRKRERNLRRLWFSLTEPTTMDVIWETSAREPAAVPGETTTRPRGEQSTRLHTQTDTHTFLNGRRPPRYYNIH